MRLRFLPWPVPSAVGCALGVMLERGFWLPALPLLLAAVLLTRSQPRQLTPLLFLLVFLLLGVLRMWQWQQREDPLADLPLGQEMLLGGSSDGTVLELEWPVRASLWISPAGSLPAGEAVVWGQVLRPEGKRNPGGFDFAAHLAARNIHGQVLVAEIRQLEPRTSLRARLSAGLRQDLSPRSYALTEALTLGERSELGELRDSFAAAGLSHLLALSGLHLGVLVVFAGRLLAPLGTARHPLLAGLVLLFLATVGLSASLLRAALMTLAYLAGEWAGSGRADAWTSLALAGLLTLLWRPVWLFDLSFQLSYLCLIGILACGGTMLEALRGKPWWHPRVLLVAPLYTSVAAQLPTVSLVASTFGLVPLLATPLNLLAIPLASLLVPLGLLAASAGAVFPPLAMPFKLLIEPLATALIAVAEWGALLPAVPWGEISPAGHWYWAAACLLLLLMFSRVTSWLPALLALSCILLASLLTPAQRPAAELIALDVGQGDAFVLRFEGGPSVLVDAGGNAWSDYDPGERVVVPALRALGITQLDLLVATHADADHIGGLPAVLDSLPVQLLALGVHDPDRDLFQELLAAAERNGVPVRSFRRGETIRLGELQLQVLNPGPVATGEANEDSLVFNVLWRGVPVAVLAGEVSAPTEALLAFRTAGVLTVPHHGSRFSSSERLLRAVSGHTAVISVGANNYGHPHPTVIRRLEDHGYRVRMTSESGAVRVPLLVPETLISTR